MVESEYDARTGVRRIVLRPNGSLSERQGWLFLAAAATVMAAIAAGFASRGLWLVFPFSGSEWLLLAICFRLSLRSSATREVITIDEGSVVMEQGRGQPERTYRFQRAWVNLDWVPPTVRGHPSRLRFRLHGRQVEVGRFLAESEREALARELRQILIDDRI